MTINERDTKFLGFAKLLWKELHATLEENESMMYYFDGIQNEAACLLIAQRAYDLVLHAFRDVDTYDLDYHQKSTYERTIMPTIQDLTEWPTE